MIESILNNPDVVIITVGTLVGIASSVVGSFLVLRKASMLSDAMSHSILLGIVAVFFITGNQYSPFYLLGAAAVGVLTVVLTESLAQSKRVNYDAAIGLVYPFLFAIAVLLINVFVRNVHIDVDAALLGEIGLSWLDTQQLFGIEVPSSIIKMVIVTLINIAFVVLFYKELKLATFDSGLAATLGFKPGFLYYALLSLTSLTAVSAFDAVGAILVVAFIIVPPASAYLLTDKLWIMLSLGSVIAFLSSALGYGSAVFLDVSISGMMALWTGVFFTLCFLFSPRYGLISQSFRFRQQKIVNAQRTLLIHLFHHENDDNSSEENALSALQLHLRWSVSESKEIVMDCLDDGLITKQAESDMLFLTDKGRIWAREVLEPWQHS